MLPSARAHTRSRSTLCSSAVSRPHVYNKGARQKPAQKKRLLEPCSCSTSRSEATIPADRSAFGVELGEVHRYRWSERTRVIGVDLECDLPATSIRQSSVRKTLKRRSDELWDIRALPSAHNLVQNTGLSPGAEDHHFKDLEPGLCRARGRPMIHEFKCTRQAECTRQMYKHEASKHFSRGRGLCHKDS